MRPASYSAQKTSFTSTYYLGFLAMFFFFLELITGLILMIYYTPTPAEAYGSILRLETEVPFGSLMRDLHRLGGELMIGVTFLHMISVYLKGSFRGTHSFTWVTGVLLFFLTLMLGFSGYLLPWDQLAFWAVTIGTSMADTIPWIGDTLTTLLRGGAVFGLDGLLRFYLLHILGLPILAALFIAVHYFRVARLHQPVPVSLPNSVNTPLNLTNKSPKIPLFPQIALKEFTLSAFILLGLIVLALFFYDAPLELHANPLHTPEATKAPWFFLWLQGGLKLGNSFIMGICFPLLLLTMLLVFPYFTKPVEDSVTRKKVRFFIVIAILAILTTLTYMGLPQYGVQKSGPAKLFQEIAVEGQKSIFHNLGYDALPVGIYETSNNLQQITSLSPSFAKWFQVFTEKVAALDRDPLISTGQGVVLVEEWQTNLKKVTVRILTTGFEDQTSLHSSEIEVFVHRHRSN